MDDFEEIAFHYHAAVRHTTYPTLIHHSFDADGRVCHETQAIATSSKTP